jgi:hypothetical protein
MLLAAALLPGKLPQLLRLLPFERPDTAPGDDQGKALRRRDRRQVNLPEVDGGLSVSWCRLRLCYLNASLVNSKPRFQTSVQAPLFAGNSSGKARDFRPLPIGSTTRPFSRLTA